MSPDLDRCIVMIADISGSAALYERLNDREAERAVERCIKRMTRSIDAYQGRIGQIIGDELLALFDTAEAACQAAIDMHQRISALPPVSGLKLGIRIALHQGSVGSNNQLPPEAIASTVRIVGLARRDQILCSQPVIAALPASGVVHAVAKEGLGPLLEDGQPFPLYQVHWPLPSDIPQQHSMFGPLSAVTVGRLCIRYRGKAFLVDDKTPVLTLGRDPGCKLLISDRKASRQHARIERRNDGYFLVDTSTNGSFVTIDNRQEVLVRRHEILLENHGVVCFGSSINDSAADRIEFEHL